MMTGGLLDLGIKADILLQFFLCFRMFIVHLQALLCCHPRVHVQVQKPTPADPAFSITAPPLGWPLAALNLLGPSSSSGWGFVDLGLGVTEQGVGGFRCRPYEIASAASQQERGEQEVTACLAKGRRCSFSQLADG